MPCPHAGHRQVLCRHVVHPFLDRGPSQIRKSGGLSVPHADKHQNLLQIPASGLHASFRLASLFELVLTELFHQFH